MTTFRTAGVHHPDRARPTGQEAAWFGRCLPVDDGRAQANRMHVRMLLKEKQPDFAAMLDSVVREFAPECMARRIGRSPGSCQEPSRATSSNPVKWLTGHE